MRKGGKVMPPPANRGGGNFKIAKALVLSNGNYSKEGKIEYMPIYFAMFLKKDALPETLTYELKI